MGIYDRLCSRQTSVGVVGLGYVGMPLALEMAKHFNVVGFDLIKKRYAIVIQRITPPH